MYLRDELTILWHLEHQQVHHIRVPYMAEIDFIDPVNFV